MSATRFSVLITGFSLLVLCFASSSFAAEPVGSFGAGVIVGEPTGLSGAYVLSDHATIDGALAYSFAREGDWQIHGDYLFTGNRIFQNQPSELDTFIGGGLRLKFEHDARFGVRIPVGVTFDIPPQPRFQLFGEFAPIVDLAPSTELSADIGIGIRYFF